MLSAIKTGALSLVKKLLWQERISQYTPDPDSKYACFFTSVFMYFRTVYKFKRTFAEYKQDCLAAGAIRSDYYLLDRTKMAVAAGHPELVCKATSQKMREKILELIIKDRPVPFSVGGTHFESIDGYETINDALYFLIDDPAGRDTHAHGDTLEVGKLAKGIFTPRIKANGAKCLITTVYWFEEK